SMPPFRTSPLLYYFRPSDQQRYKQKNEHIAQGSVERTLASSSQALGKIRRQARGYNVRGDFIKIISGPSEFRFDFLRRYLDQGNACPRIAVFRFADTAGVYENLVVDVLS